jgi:hypothetical protein
MDNPEKLATSGTQESWRTKTHKSENQTDEQRKPHQKPGVNPSVDEGAHASHKTRGETIRRRRGLMPLIKPGVNPSVDEGDSCLS